MKYGRWIALGIAGVLLCSMTVFAARTAGGQPNALKPGAMPPEAAQPGIAAQPGTGAAQTSSREEMPMVADAAKYRGEVTKLEKQGDNIALTLRQADGTNFGSQTLDVLITPDTRTYYTADQLVVGAYVEIYYGVAWGPNQQKLPTLHAVQEAISADVLTPAQIVVFNGEVVEVMDGFKDTKMSLLMRTLDGSEEVIFHISEETKIYMNESAIKPGARLNLLSSGARTMSLPGQSAALEIYKYYAPATDASAVIDVG